MCSVPRLFPYGLRVQHFAVSSSAPKKVLHLTVSLSAPVQKVLHLTVTFFASLQTAEKAAWQTRASTSFFKVVAERHGGPRLRGGLMRALVTSSEHPSHQWGRMVLPLECVMTYSIVVRLRAMWSLKALLPSSCSPVWALESCTPHEEGQREHNEAWVQVLKTTCLPWLQGLKSLTCLGLICRTVAVVTVLMSPMYFEQHLRSEEDHRWACENTKWVLMRCSETLTQRSQNS